MRKTLNLILIVSAVACLAGGCMPRGQLAMPENFVELDEQRRGDYEVRGISADGVVIGLRRHDNLKNGSLPFWQDALRNELSTRGYRPAGETEEITSTGGATGKLMTFKTTSRGTEFLYILAMYVQPTHVTTIEAGGKADIVRKHLDELKQSMRSIR
ncbi:MAG: hypothetical protein ACOCVI_02815 [Planctomycetota bacterium]